MVLLLCPHVEKTGNIKIARLVAERLGRAGARCVADDLLRPVLGETQYLEYLPKQAAEAACDYLVAIGGDGTILQVSQRAIRLDKPLFGINTGRVGFLAAFDGGAVSELTPQAIEQLNMSKRLLLDFSVRSVPDSHYYAVNDVVIQRASTSNTIELGIEYGRHTVARIRADGIIVATPTGSTAYSLSAGGPVVGPAVEAFVITPICAHNLAARSFVLGALDTVRITPTLRHNNTATVNADGISICTVGPGDVVNLRVGEKYLRLMTSEKRNFYGILNREISEKD